MPTADELLNVAAVANLIACLERVAPARPLSALRECKAMLGPQGFRERVDAVQRALLTDLPADYARFEEAIRAALGDPQFSGWLIAPVAEAVATRALATSRADTFDAGLALLADLTPRLTAEFALRSFLAADFDRALAAAIAWTAHVDEHVRRLASEGTRPRLPWARRVGALLARPEATSPILDALYRDSSEYVRRSVANHLNDLSRDHPDLAVESAARWLRAPDANTPALVRHALRTLIKQADPRALALLGFTPLPDLIVDGLRLAGNTVAIGGELHFEFSLQNGGERPVRAAIDYIIHHRKANGTLTPKVFKLTVRNLLPGEQAAITRKHSFKVISTRAYYPGEHAIELQINGARFGKTAFDLVSPAAVPRLVNESGRGG